MIFCKIIRPDEAIFSKSRERATFSLMYVCPINDPQEKYCYAEIPDNLFEDFLTVFGAEDVEIIDRSEFPDNFVDMVKGRIRKFTILQSRDQPPLNSLTSTLSS